MTSTEYTLIPAGAPPSSLESGEDEAILKWCQECQAGRPRDRLANEAFKYWLRYFHGVGTPEHSRICERIDALVKDIAPARMAPVIVDGGGEAESEG